MEKLAFTINDAVDFSGLARSRLYILAKEGKVDMIKVGRRTLVTGDSLRSYIASLPAPAGGTLRAS